jgi:hypothetical protein
MAKVLKILLIEDMPQDAEAVRKELRKEGLKGTSGNL